MEEALTERLLKILSNPDEVEAPLVATIAEEAETMVGDRDLAQPFVLDIAIYRYLMVKEDLHTSAYEEAYKHALRALDRAPHRVPDGAPVEGADFGVAVGERGAVWI